MVLLVGVLQVLEWMEFVLYHRLKAGGGSILLRGHFSVGLLYIAALEVKSDQCMDLSKWLNYLERQRSCHYQHYNLPIITYIPNPRSLYRGNYLKYQMICFTYRRKLTICPIIEGEEQLRLLNYQHNLISSIEHLSGLRRLIFLDLYDNRIEEISGLCALKSLRVLMLGKNR